MKTQSNGMDPSKQLRVAGLPFTKKWDRKLLSRWSTPMKREKKVYQECLDSLYTELVGPEDDEA